jgi:hypothetical protein
MALRKRTGPGGNIEQQPQAMRPIYFISPDIQIYMNNEMAEEFVDFMQDVIDEQWDVPQALYSIFCNLRNRIDRQRNPNPIE